MKRPAKPHATPRPTVFYVPRKVLPWSSMTSDGKPVKVDDDAFGFLVAYVSEKALCRKFGDEAFLVLHVEEVKRPRRAKRKP